jgi:hypothetical protein
MSKILKMLETAIVKQISEALPGPGSAPSSPMLVPPATEIIPTTPDKTVLEEGVKGAPRAPFFIIGAGLSRTGTEAMAAAMEILFGGRAYHGGTAIVVGGIAKEGVLWKRSEGGPDFGKIFDLREDGIVYNSTFDLPGNFYVKELMERYPNYRVILTMRRSAEEWADSVLNTIVPVSAQLHFLDKITCRRVGPIHRAMEFADEYGLVKRLGISNDETTREQLIQEYNMHLEYIRRIVPTDRLIEFQAGDGWDGLCRSLNVPVPNVPFPRKNERGGFKWRIGIASCKTFSRNNWPYVTCFAGVTTSVLILLNYVILRLLGLS